MHDEPEFLEALRRVDHLLRSRGVPYALIGAVAMALYGVPRFTADIDLLTCSPEVLAADFWLGFGPLPSIARGDAEDPFLGVVRFGDPKLPALELMVGRFRWQERMVKRAPELAVGALRVPVVDLADLVILKLFAAGFQDRSDVMLLLNGMDRGKRQLVASRLRSFPHEMRVLWTELQRHARREGELQ
ncbi:MAG: nucleotidyltransferase [Thermoanaerobaculum sp.]